jgi:hypothetical protein
VGEAVAVAVGVVVGSAVEAGGVSVGGVGVTIGEHPENRKIKMRRAGRALFRNCIGLNLRS